MTEAATIVRDIGKMILQNDSLILLKRLSLRPAGNMRSLDYNRFLSWAEYGQVRRGCLPRSCEDKWLIFQPRGELHFCRSGNGLLVYAIIFAHLGPGFEAVSARVNADPALLDPLPEEYECRVIDYLIDRLLLGREVLFPLPDGLDRQSGQVLERIWMGDCGRRV
ncbi:MAG: hypothetical protein A3F83_07105 [Candidatus Glassbacteria bacterium RIFCSPLOWO2_12_FULL_58_11]|uniref:Uncharacterized protein n=1 Tax=Candidatus Glassbacteria bacterium RIFCSPLOWO2_12_FULL_58_11 TaxID=1817867 RepID=A0A1F5YSX1_9BACT|nr:MAG: hypothetical protein A3F83_07105 [Candidatus Glassbacteria bacterium RIFCSPLOWO2_12_FULL_58_11]